MTLSSCLRANTERVEEPLAKSRRSLALGATTGVAEGEGDGVGVGDADGLGVGEGVGVGVGVGEGVAATGTTLSLTGDTGDVPAKLTATAEKIYPVLFISPVILQLPDEPVTVHVLPPMFGLAVIVNEVAGLPEARAETVIVTS